MTRLMLKRARASPSSGTWKDEEPRRARRRRGGAAITGPGSVDSDSRAAQRVNGIVQSYTNAHKC